MKIYNVYGETGEYSDYGSWNVLSFSHEKAAEEFRDLLNLMAKEYKRLEEECCYSFCDECVEAREKIKELDPCFSNDYTSTNYEIAEIELCQNSDIGWKKKADHLIRYFKNARRKLKEEQKDET